MKAGVAPFDPQACPNGRSWRAFSAAVFALTVFVACSSSSGGGVEGGGDAGSSGSTEDLLGGGEGGVVPVPNEVVLARDPVDCEEAKTSKSYVGCDYWPTVTPNVVAPIFDFVAVVANTGTNEAAVTVTGPNDVNTQVTVPPGGLKKVHLPWVSELKGPERGAPSTLLSKGGAYHLVSSSPVIVYQFNALQYKGGGQGPNGEPKDWSKCPDLIGQGCFSYSNDASLLLPSTAMTGNYRVTGMSGFNGSFLGIFGAKLPAVLTITATAPETKVKVKLAEAGGLRAGGLGGGITLSPVAGGGTLEVSLPNAGDVAQLVTAGDEKFDFSGSLVQADKPVQVLSSVPCIYLPKGVTACDHIEETVMPAETFGKHYVVGTPTGATGKPAQQIVRFYGNRENTTLTYSPTKPAGCPDKLGAGQMIECGPVEESFEVTGDQEFAVTSFLLGAAAYPDSQGMGDPSQTTHPAVEQYRTKYVFLAPDDYPVQWADVIGAEDAAIQLDGAPAKATWTKIGAGPYGTFRLDLTKSGKDGAHVLTSSKPVAVQVSGYGQYTSFQYPAGLNLNLIAPPPDGPK
ncbi:MAG TPA: IgGFc-binding protein [Labilithrix sp.]|nr:IgGFc-binding protein [Labilithrix sp.]